MSIYKYLLISVLGMNFYLISDTDTVTTNVYDEDDVLNIDDGVFGDTDISNKIFTTQQSRNIIKDNKEIIKLLTSEYLEKQKIGRNQLRALPDTTQEVINKKVKYLIALNIAKKILNENLKGIQLSNIYNGFYEKNEDLVNNVLDKIRKNKFKKKVKNVNDSDYQKIIRCISLIQKLYCVKTKSSIKTKDDLMEMLKSVNCFNDINISDDASAKKYIESICKTFECGALKQEVFQNIYSLRTIVKILLRISSIRKSIMQSSDNTMSDKLKASLLQFVKNGEEPITDIEIQKLSLQK